MVVAQDLAQEEVIMEVEQPIHQEPAMETQVMVATAMGRLMEAHLTLEDIRQAMDIQDSVVETIMGLTLTC